MEKILLGGGDIYQAEKSRGTWFLSSRIDNLVPILFVK
jgi:hypothetical protein